MDRDELLDIVAHELKSPLTPLKAAAQLMRMRIRKARDAGRELDVASLDRNAAMVERQVDRMDRLVTGVLEITRMGRGRFTLARKRFDVADTVREAVGAVTEALEENEVRHHFDVRESGPTLLHGDEGRVLTVVTGLIENAVKFSPEGGTVVVSASGGDGEVTVTVRDEGIGVGAADLAGLGTTPFERPERTATYAGLGIGLYLARAVAEGHGGRLEISSEGAGKGTTATLTLRDMEAAAAG